MNRFAHTLLALALLPLASARAPLEARHLPLSSRTQKPPLLLTVTLLSKKCVTWNQSELLFRLQFTNGGHRPIILHKPDLFIITIKYFAFINEERNEVHIGEYAVDRLRGDVSDYKKTLITKRPNAEFLVLPPGRSYTTQETEGIPLIRALSASEVGSNPIDTYQVDLEVSTWWFDLKLADSLERKWKTIGMLWTKPIWSKQIDFTFPRKRTCETATSAR
jgi:hypothetical protein